MERDSGLSVGADQGRGQDSGGGGGACPLRGAGRNGGGAKTQEGHEAKSGSSQERRQDSGVGARSGGRLRGVARIQGAERRCAQTQKAGQGLVLAQEPGVGEGAAVPTPAGGRRSQALRGGVQRLQA